MHYFEEIKHYFAHIYYIIIHIIQNDHDIFYLLYIKIFN